MELSYSSARKASQLVTNSNSGDEMRSYQLINNYLIEFQKLNPGAFIDVQVNGNNEITHIFCCLEFMNNNMQYVKPVISFDACHQKGT